MGEQYKCADSKVGDADISRLIFFSNRTGTVVPVETIGKRIKALRQARQLTQTKLSDALGPGVASQGAISQLEGGEGSVSGLVLVHLCRVLNTTPEFIMFGANDAESLERQMAVAELTSIGRKLPAQALELMLSSARMAARITSEKADTQDPHVHMPPEPAAKQHKQAQGVKKQKPRGVPGEK